jgi:hypothetical protein
MNIDEVLRWLARADEDLTLVGGQSVALREHLLGLPVLTETVDIDFLGDLLDALPEPQVFATSAFTQEHYPRQIERVKSRRERYARFLESRRNDPS